MAGLGRKSFSPGDVLAANEVNGFLMDQSVMVFANVAARTAAIPTPSAGMVTFLVDTAAVEVFDGVDYTSIGGAAAAAGFPDFLLMGA